MIRTHVYPCSLPRQEADALNRASGQVYSRVLVHHWRIVRHSDHWLSPTAAEKLDDYNGQEAERLLHAHSIDAAQQAFYKACKTARTNRRKGAVENARFPFRRTSYRTTLWKNTGIRQLPDCLLLARARGLEPVCVPLSLPGEVREARLVYDVIARRYTWHFVIEDGRVAVPVEEGKTAAIDLGEVHPVALTDGAEVCIVSCRELRSVAQHTNKTLARLQHKLSRCQRRSRRARRLQRAKRRFLAKQKRRRRDLAHKVSRATIAWCQERHVGTLAIGDVRDVADRTREERRLSRASRQKVSDWSHGTIRQYLGYKAEAAGIVVHDEVPEHHTSQTCLACGQRHKPKGRTYHCPSCGFVFARDGVGCANLLSRQLHGELGKIRPNEVKYRKPFQRGLRSPVGTRQVACGSKAAT